MVLVLTALEASRIATDRLIGLMESCSRSTRCNVGLFVANTGNMRRLRLMQRLGAACR